MLAVSDLGEPNGNGETDEERMWREHGERFDAVRALEKRLGSLETTMRERFRDIETKIDLVLAGIQEQRADVKDLYKQWVRQTDRQIDLDKRVAALEGKPRRGKKKR